MTNFRSPQDPRAGGGQTATDDLARALLAAGHRVRAVFAGPPSAGMPYPVTAVREGRRTWLTALSVARAVRDLEARHRVDVVHTTGYEGAFVKARAAVVTTLHNPGLPRWQLPPPRQVLGRLRFLRGHQQAALEHRCLSRAALTIFVSEHSRERTAALGYPTRASAVLPNGVDTRLFRPPSGPPPGSHRPQVLFIGRLDEQKGVDVLLRAWSALDGKADLRLVGTGWREAHYRELAGALGLRSVIFEGHVARERLPVRIQEARVVVLPSRYENFPLVLLEALACGVPVVSSRVGGIAELVHHEEHGLLVPPEDAEALATALRRLVDDAELARRMGTAGRLRIECEYSWETIATRTVALYRQCLAEGPLAGGPRR